MIHEEGGEIPSLIQMTEERRRELLERLAGHFEHPETAPWDWDVLREGKLAPAGTL